MIHRLRGIQLNDATKWEVRGGQDLGGGARRTRHVGKYHGNHIILFCFGHYTGLVRQTDHSVNTNSVCNIKVTTCFYFYFTVTVHLNQ